MEPVPSHLPLQAAWRLIDPLPRTVPTGWEPLDRALGGGLPRGDLVEVVCARAGEGALTLALALGRRLVAALDAEEAAGRAFVLVDPEPGAFLPVRHWPAEGIRVRPRDGRGALAVLDRVLRCPAVAAAVAPPPLLEGRRLDLAASMRLRQAARAGGGTAILLRPEPAPASAAGVRLRVRRSGCPGAREPLRVEVLRVRGAPGAEAPLELAV